MTTPMSVTEAVLSRRSIRAFRPDPVSDGLIAEILTTALRSPSGGNVQPWRIYALNGDTMTRFLAYLEDKPPVEETEYPMYPEGLTEPYRTNRFALGEQMYELLGIPREDKAARLQIGRAHV